MTLLESLKSQGISVNGNSSTEGMLDLLTNIPMLNSMFPEVMGMVTQLQSYLDSYNNAKASLAKAEDYVNQMDNLLVKAKDAYDQMLNTPTAYAGAGTGTVVITPQPTLQTFYQAIVIAQKNVDSAQEALKKAKDLVSSIDDTINKYKDSIVSKLMSIKVV